MVIEDNSSRQKLLEVAGRLFAEKGVDGVSTREIAGRAQVNISLISYYFQGKEGLYRAVIENFALQARSQLGQRLAEIEKLDLDRDSYVEFMTNIVRSILKMKVAFPYMSAIMYRELIAGLPHAREIHEQIFGEMAERILSLMEVAQKKKIIRKDLHLLTNFISMVHAIDGYFLLSKCDTRMVKKCIKVPEHNEQYVEQMVKIFIEGVLA